MHAKVKKLFWCQTRLSIKCIQCMHSAERSLLSILIWFFDRYLFLFRDSWKLGTQLSLIPPDLFSKFVRQLYPFWIAAEKFLMEIIVFGRFILCIATEGQLIKIVRRVLGRILVRFSLHSISLQYVAEKRAGLSLLLRFVSACAKFF